MVKYIELSCQLTRMPKDAVAYKYNDPVDEARWLYDGDEAHELSLEGAPIEWPIYTDEESDK